MRTVYISYNHEEIMGSTDWLFSDGVFVRILADLILDSRQNNTNYNLHRGTGVDYFYRVQLYVQILKL